MWGAKGEIKTNRGDNIFFELQFKSVNSLTQIINELIHVLKEKDSMSSVTFLIVLLKILSELYDGVFSLKLKTPPLWYNFQSFFKKLWTPIIPLLFHGFVC